jgi:2-oxoglutarate dehydrogenase E2 component (dihydrolipoamide succinyltransferase)
MARVEVVMPQMGESIAEGTITKWYKKVGDPVKKDETLLEISTDKVDSEIPSPSAGILAQIVVEEQKTVPVQTVIAYLETDAAATAEVPQAPAEQKEARPPKEPRQAKPVAPEVKEKPVSQAGRFYSPLVLNIANSEGIPMEELEKIEGTGEGGRVRKKDVLAYVASRGGKQQPPTVAQVPPAMAASPRPGDVPELRVKYPAPGHEIVQMTNVLQKMAAHMVKSVQTSPHVAAVHEVDMTTIVAHRAGEAAAFEKREGFKLTYTPYIVDAVVRAIKKYPLINSSVEGDKIIRKNYINLGVAVASENGLIVPVVRNAEEKNFIGLARAVNDIAVRTRTKKLTPDDIQGGTFTISNYGVFGTLIGTPIINQPQVAILGTGAIKKRAMVLDDAIAIRSMAFFTLSFDHRIVDGALGGMFLEEVVRNLESFDPSVHF